MPILEFKVSSSAVLTWTFFIFSIGIKKYSKVIAVLHRTPELFINILALKAHLILAKDLPPSFTSGHPHVLKTLHYIT